MNLYNHITYIYYITIMILIIINVLKKSILFICDLYIS